MTRARARVVDGSSRAGKVSARGAVATSANDRRQAQRVRDPFVLGRAAHGGDCGRGSLTAAYSWTGVNEVVFPLVHLLAECEWGGALPLKQFAVRLQRLGHRLPEIPRDMWEWRTFTRAELPGPDHLQGAREDVYWPACAGLGLKLRDGDESTTSQGASAFGVLAP